MIQGGFDVEADQLGSSVSEGFGVALRLGKHEMDVEEESWSVASKFGDHLRAEGEIGHEMAVHDVQMQPCRPGGGDLGGALGKAGVLAGEEGWSENRGMRHVWMVVKLSGAGQG